MIKNVEIQQSLCWKTVGMHLLTLLLVYAYVKEELTFNFCWALLPSILVLIAEGYHLIRNTSGIKRAKYLISLTLLFLFLITLTKVIKNQGGMHGGMDDTKWLIRHRRCFELLLFAMGAFILYSLIDYRKQRSTSIVKQVLLNVLSTLSTPLTVCSGGACNSIYISTFTSIMSSFSVPLTLVVPILNVFGYVLQLIGLLSIYSANKWRSLAFWLYLSGIICQLLITNWLGCIIMVVAVILNARSNKFIYGRKLFKQQII